MIRTDPNQLNDRFLSIETRIAVEREDIEEYLRRLEQRLDGLERFVRKNQKAGRLS